MTLLMALITTRFSLHYLADTHFSVFCEVFLKPRTFLPAYDNFGKETIVFFGYPIPLVDRLTTLALHVLRHF